jgi:hypothetical protein
MPGPLTPRHKGTVYWRWCKISSLLLRVFRLSVNMSDLVWTQWRVDACTRRGSEWVRPPNARLHTVRTIGEFRRGQHQNGAGGGTRTPVTGGLKMIRTTRSMRQHKKKQYTSTRSIATLSTTTTTTSTSTTRRARRRRARRRRRRRRARRRRRRRRRARRRRRRRWKPAWSCAASKLGRR